MSETGTFSLTEISAGSAPEANKSRDRLATLILLVASADFLLFRQPDGLGLPILLLLLAAAVALPCIRRAHDGTWIGRALLAVVAVLPLVENSSPLALIAALTGMAIYALASTGKLEANGGALLRQLGGFFLLAPFRLPADAWRARLMYQPGGGSGALFSGALVWVVPAVFGAIFLLLFGIANPVIEDWLNRIDLAIMLDYLDPARLVFWAVAACGLWAVLRPRFIKLKSRTAVETKKPERADPVFSALFGRGALLRALLVFNVLFAVQNGLDVVYLWGGVALPEGMNYATYAHRGAYALIATALLAAGFVLAAMRPGSESAADRTIRLLVYAWTAQNIWLVPSSILRLDLYVDVYALTYWRVAAFLWMVLVGAGLALIVARIALEKSNQWLVSANLTTLSAMLYACCFINFAGLIANYNVDHSLEMRGSGQPIDIVYLGELGPQAIPALDRLLAAQLTEPLCGYGDTREKACIQSIRLRHALDSLSASDNWRSWTFRHARLMRYLAAQASLPAGPDERAS
jgi:hypothetical protein